MARKIVLVVLAASLVVSFVMKQQKKVSGQPASKPPITHQQKPVTEEEQFAKQVVRCLQSGNAAQWMALHYNDESQFALNLQKDIVARRRPMDKSFQDSLVEKIKQRFFQQPPSFRQIQELAKQSGLNLPKASFQSFEFKVEQSADEEQTLKGCILLKDDITVFKVEGIEAIKTGEGYRLTQVASIKKVNERNW